MGNMLFPNAFGTILTGIQAQMDFENNSPSNEQGNERATGNRHRNRGFALEEVNHLADSTFESMFKVTRAGFEELLEIISPSFMHDTSECMAVRSSGSVVSKRTK